MTYGIEDKTNIRKIDVIFGKLFPIASYYDKKGVNPEIHWFGEVNNAYTSIQQGNIKPAISLIENVLSYPMPSSFNNEPNTYHTRLFTDRKSLKTDLGRIEKIIKQSQIEQQQTQLQE